MGETLRNSFLPLLFVLFVCGLCCQCVGATITSSGVAGALATVTAGGSALATAASVKRVRSGNEFSSQSKRTRTGTDNCKDGITTDAKAHPAIAILSKCGATDAILQLAMKLLREETDNPIKLIIISLLNLLGDEVIGTEALKTKFVSLKEELHAAFMKLSGDDYKGRVNFGDCLSVDTVLLIIKHYAPISCVGKICEGVYNLIWRRNVCIAQFLKVLPRSLHKEAKGGDFTKEIQEDVGKKIRFIDMILLVPNEKKALKTEVKKFAKDHNVTTGDLELVTFIFYCMHSKFYKLVNGGDGVLAVLCASIKTFSSWFGDCVSFENDQVAFGGNIPHGQVFAARHIANPIIYPEEILVEISAKLLWAYTFVAVKVEQYVVPTKEDGTMVAQRFAGNLTHDERMSLLEVMIEACRKGGRNAGKMRTDAATLVRLLRADGYIKTNEDAYAFIELYLSVNHRRLWEGSVEGGIEGAATTAKMNKDGAKFVHDRITIHGDTVEAAVELMRTELSNSHATLYEGRGKGAPLPQPPKACNSGKWSSDEMKHLEAGFIILGSTTDYAGLASFVPTRNNHQIEGYMRHEKLRKQTAFQELEAKVNAFHSTPDWSVEALPNETGEPRQIERKMQIQFNVGEKLGASIKNDKTNNQCKVTITSEGSKLQVGDTILYVGDRDSGVFFSEFEGTWSDWSKLFDPKKRRMVLVSRYYDWPSVSAPAIAKAAASIATTVKVAASTTERNVVSRWEGFGRSNETNDAKWHANLSQLKPCIKDGGKMDYSSITDHKVVKKLMNFVKNQRRYYKLRQENKNSSLTDDRVNALVAEKFCFKPR